MAKSKRKISTQELLDRMKALRKKPVTPEFADKFNKIVEDDDRSGPSQKDGGKKKIARSPEADT